MLHCGADTTPPGLPPLLSHQIRRKALLIATGGSEEEQSGIVMKKIISAVRGFKMVTKGLWDIRFIL